MRVLGLHVCSVKLVLIALATSLLVGAVEASADWFIHTHYGHTHLLGYAVPLLLGAFTNLILVSWLLIVLERKKRAMVHRAEILGEVNHEIRNALEVMGFHGYIHSREELKVCVARIEECLRDILPKVEDD